MLHAGAASGVGPGEVGQGGPLRARQLWGRGPAVVNIILRSAVAGWHWGPGGGCSGAGDLQGLLTGAVCGEGKQSDWPGTAWSGSQQEQHAALRLRACAERGAARPLG